MPPLAAFYVPRTGDCATAETVRAALLRREARVNEAKHRHWPSRRSPASFPWGSVLVGEE